MAHAQKPDFVFPRNGRVHLNRWGRQFSLLLAAEVRASAWVMLDRPRSEVAWEYWLPTQFATFPFTSPPVRHHVPPGSEPALLFYRLRTHPSPMLFPSVWQVTCFHSACVKWLPIPVAARSKAWVRIRSLARFAVSNPAGGMDICVLTVLCLFR